MFKRTNLVLAAMAFILFFTPAIAAAGQLFTFNYIFQEYSCPTCYVAATGTLLTSDFDPISNSYTILNITGTRRTETGVVETITGLIPAGGFGGNDNLLLTLPTELLTTAGLSFQVANPTGGNDGFGNVNVFYGGIFGYTEIGPTIGYGTFTVNHAVPEPATGPVMIVVGLAAIVAGRLRLIGRK